MGTINYITTAAGEELAILPRADLEALMEDAVHLRALSDYRSGRDTGLTADEMRALLAAPSPLALWRRKRGMTQANLAAAVGLAQNTLSALETGKREGSPAQWLKIAKTLDVPIKDLIEEE
jgi:DNA-binding XRE family transcriptional regulator